MEAIKGFFMVYLAIDLFDIYIKDIKDQITKTWSMHLKFAGKTSLSNIKIIKTYRENQITLITSVIEMGLNLIV